MSIYMTYSVFLHAHNHLIQILHVIRNRCMNVERRDWVIHEQLRANLIYMHIIAMLMNLVLFLHLMHCYIVFNFLLCFILGCWYNEENTFIAFINKTMLVCFVKKLLIHKNLNNIFGCGKKFQYIIVII